MTNRVRILLVDDQRRARQSLKALLSTWPRLQTIWEAADGLEAIDLVEKHQPDLALMDLRMPEMDGLQATRIIKARWPQVRILVLTLYGEYEAEAMAAGADGFVGKGEPPDSLLAALSVLVSGKTPARDHRG